MAEPNFQDRVKHRTSKEVTTGVVIAKYAIYDMQHLDVRTDEDKIIYKTPAKNWETIETEAERYE